MDFETIQGLLPGYAKDLRLNLKAVTTSDALDDERLFGAILSSALATGCRTLIRAATAEAEARLSPEAIDAARAAAALMGMNNVYYRFLHLVEDPSYGSIPARLRMQRIASPGVDRANFELWSLAVSAINGCGKCITSHEKVLRDHGVSQQSIQEAVRVAAILAGVAGVIDAEEIEAPAA